MGKTPSCEKNGLKKGPWTAEEDQKLIDYIHKHGHGRWRTLPKNAGLKRCGKSCRLRWTNYLRPDIKRGRFSFEEEETIIQLHSVLGNKWSAIATRLPGRTDNEIKNYWNTHIRKKLLRMGIDPVTHSPRLDVLELSSLLSSSLYNPSQLIPNTLGIQPIMNHNLLSLATSLLASQHKNPEEIIQQNLQTNQVNNPHFQDQIQSFQENQLQCPNQETIQACTATSGASNAPFFNGVQSNGEPFSQDSTNFSYIDNLSNMWQNNGNTITLASSIVPIPNGGYNYGNGTNQSSLIDPLSQNQLFLSENNENIQNSGFGSVLSTPASSSQTQLNSSSTTCVNGSTNEDERDSYCSNILMFDMQSSLNVNGFM